MYPGVRPSRSEKRQIVYVEIFPLREKFGVMLDLGKGFVWELTLGKILFTKKEHSHMFSIIVNA